MLEFSTTIFFLYYYINKNEILLNYIIFKAFTKYVNEKGNANQNHSFTHINIAIITTVEIKNKSQSVFDEDVSS